MSAEASNSHHTHSNSHDNWWQLTSGLTQPHYIRTSIPLTHCEVYILSSCTSCCQNMDIIRSSSCFSQFCSLSISVFFCLPSMCPLPVIWPDFCLTFLDLYSSFTKHAFFFYLHLDLLPDKRNKQNVWVINLLNLDVKYNVCVLYTFMTNHYNNQHKAFHLQ